MAKISQSDAVALQDGAKLLFQRVLRTVFNTKFTYADHLMLFVPEQWRDLFMQASSVAEIGYGRTADFTVAGVLDQIKVRVWVNGPEDARPLVPRRPQLNEDAPPELLAKFRASAQFQLNAALDFARLRTVIGHLVNYGMSPRQALFCLPGLRVLAELKPDAVSAAFKGAMKASGVPDMPTLPMGVRRALRSCARTIAATQLLDEGSLPEDWDSPVTVYLMQGQQAYDDELGETLPLTVS